MVDIYIYIYIYFFLCVYVCYRPYICAKMSGRDYENLTINFDCIYFQNFSMKTKLILGF